MVFKRFTYNIIARTVLLAGTILAFFTTIFAENYYVLPFALFFAIVLQIYFIVQIQNQTNNNLTRLLQAVDYDDFSLRIKNNFNDSSFEALYNSLNNLLENFRKLRSEKEKNYHYLQNIIKHIDVAIITFDKNGKIHLYNGAAKNLLRRQRLDYIDEIKSFDSQLWNAIKQLKSGEKKLLTLKNTDLESDLLLYCSEFKDEFSYYKIISLKNIKPELEEKELEAWQKLIKVLTHEIMNSIAPISSLTSTINAMISDMENQIIDKLPDEEKESLKDIKFALQTIKQRSDGLIRFVETYRNLTKIPKPNFSYFSIKNMIDNIVTLHNDILQKNNIKVVTQINPVSLKLYADAKLIDQVIINLFLNSIQALENTNKKNKTIIIKAFKNLNKHTVIQITDNGYGIMQDVIDKIFIPFFTTKSKGTGVGLSFSKQIMRLHGGLIKAESIPGEKTIFTLIFKL